jgi:hypothetical protein
MCEFGKYTGLPVYIGRPIKEAIFAGQNLKRKQRWQDKPVALTILTCYM